MLPYDTLLMMENNSDSTFLGQQEGEKILSVLTPHQSIFTLEYIKLFLVSLFLLVGFVSLQKISPLFVYIGIPFSIFTLIIGFLLYRSIHSKRVAYITNRRIIRFEPSNAFVVNSRSLTWDNIIKVKTFSPGFLWRLKNIGTVIIHSKTTSANDDIILKNIHYYKDLGHYIDKILYLYAHDPKELETIRPFVDKPKGQRY
jgi:hypothetical protein